MKETLHIIARALTPLEVEEIKSATDDLAFMHFNIKEFDLPNRTYNSQLQAEQKKLINYKVMDQILRFSNENVVGQSVSGLMEFQKMNLWFYQRLTVYMAARNLEYLLEEARLATEKYAVILYTSIPDNTLAYHLPESIKLKCGSGNNSVQREKTLTIGLAMLLALLRIALRSASKIQGKHLILDNAKPVALYNDEQEGVIKGNFVFNNLFKKLDKRFCLIREAGLPGKRTARLSEYKNSFQYRSLNIRHISSDLILFRSLISNAARKKIRSIRKELDSSIDALNNEFLNSEYSLITHLLTGLKSSFRIYIMRYIGFRELCIKYRPLSLTASDENSPYNKSLLDAAKSLGIKTIGIQHGAIHELHPSYRLSKEEAGENIATDVTLVWGNYWKDLLISTGNYKASGLKVTGQIRTDIIPLLKNSATDTYKNNKIILFASQPQRDPTLRKKAAADLFEAAAKFDDITIRLKPHPREKDYKEYYSSIAESKSMQKIEYVADKDLFELINSSDAVFTCFSTVGTEAIYFSKPLIVHDPLKQDIQGYISVGVGYRVMDVSDCETALKRIAAKSFIQDAKAVSNFIDTYAYRIDGKVSDRVLSEITDGF